MGYIYNNLMPGERILLYSKIHVIIFIWPVLWFGLAVSMIVIGGAAIALFSIFIFLSFLSGIFTLINFLASEYAITNKRIIGKTGFIRINSTDLFIEKVEGVQIDQSILGRVLNYGSLIVTGTGGLKSKLPKLPKPLNFRNLIYNQIHPEDSKLESESIEANLKSKSDLQPQDEEGRYIIE